jgi:hypothetical protein
MEGDFMENGVAVDELLEEWGREWKTGGDFTSR